MTNTAGGSGYSRHRGKGLSGETCLSKARGAGSAAYQDIVIPGGRSSRPSCDTVPLRKDQAVVPVELRGICRWNSVRIPELRGFVPEQSADDAQPPGGGAVIRRRPNRQPNFELCLSGKGDALQRIRVLGWSSAPVGDGVRIRSQGLLGRVV